MPKSVVCINLKAQVRKKEFKLFYNFDNSADWFELPCCFKSIIISDDYIQQSGFFTGAFVGLSCNDMTGGRINADFDKFIYKEL